MCVAFDVKLSNYMVVKHVGKPCFAAINNVTRGMSGHIYPLSIKYLPFLVKRWDREEEVEVEEVVLPTGIDWETCDRWWAYLMSLDFITSALVQKRTSNLGYKAGFEVQTDIPADRMMVVLFLLRAPQFMPGIVQTFTKLVDKGYDKDLSFVAALAINDYQRMISEREQALQFNPNSSTESTIIYPERFTIKGAKIMLNRLLCDDWDKDLYGGKQSTFRSAKHYKRASVSNSEALGRFFCKAPSGAYSRGNIQCTLMTDILKNPTRLHSNMGWMETRTKTLNDNHIEELMQLLAV
jgi:hypothetical protein